MNHGFMRVAAIVPHVSVADVEANVTNIIQQYEQCVEKGVSIVVAPELCITAYTCGDLLHSDCLLDAAIVGLGRICDATANSNTTIVVGLPIRHGGAVYNCAAVLAQGKVWGIVPKTYLPTYNEFYEKRWFASAPKEDSVITLPGIVGDVAFGTHRLFDIDGAKVGIEICEDLWAPITPGMTAALNGAEIVLNLSASDDLIGKYDHIRNMVRDYSARLQCAYIYTSAGFGESSTDLVFNGKIFISECGKMLATNERFRMDAQIAITDIDIQAIRHNRITANTFVDCATNNQCTPYSVTSVPGLAMLEAEEEPLLRTINPNPFIPGASQRLNERCQEISSIQELGLCKRLSAINCHCAVIGISGGLDSTLALLVTVGAFKRLNIDTKNILGITMPGFGTTNRTYNNALDLMKHLGVTVLEINISAAVTQHFEDIGHDANVHDVTYENSQARERTQILMDIANANNGIVIGTGDMSELALGWATYNGDHMSMYGVNVGVPKTLVKYLVGYYSRTTDNPKIAEVLSDIIDTPISPELIPADSKGNITQKTEDLVGPYQLHDFFLYHTLRYGRQPKDIYYLAEKAFIKPGTYKADEVKHWLTTFMRRFFNQQFKRSCLPDGPKVGSVCLSPRGDWRMPSDAVSALWMAQCREL